MQLIFATNNQHKVIEIKSVIHPSIQIISLQEAGINIEIPEPYNTLQENASTKSNTIFKLTNKNCFSEDTGLFIESLQNKPGVKSARFAVDEPAYKSNNHKVLTLMEGMQNRKAYFKTVISLIWFEKEYFFEGICRGFMHTKELGNKGFGYDAIFIPDGSNITFAEMDLFEKNKYSHRQKAVQLFIQFLKNYNGKS
ncbi:MAG: RdgB/HAM1 family non-canonical purine NTP pyrophosphatase [Sediminibacterium sp.]|nr:RdgB/HAM1 family non-canonical purine NTP pyrophosphatase [Sediminibacterium sp.]